MRCSGLTSLRVFLIVSTALVAPIANAVPVLIADGTLGGAIDLSGSSRSRWRMVCPAIFSAVLGQASPMPAATHFWRCRIAARTRRSYNPAIDDTTSYISRFQTLNMTLTPSGGPLPYTLTPTLTKNDAAVEPDAARLWHRRRSRQQDRRRHADRLGRADAEHREHVLLHRPLRQFRSGAKLGQSEQRALRSRIDPRLE